LASEALCEQLEGIVVEQRGMSSWGRASQHSLAKKGRERQNRRKGKVLAAARQRRCRLHRTPTVTVWETVTGCRFVTCMILASTCSIYLLSVKIPYEHTKGTKGTKGKGKRISFLRKFILELSCSTCEPSSLSLQIAGCAFSSQQNPFGID